MASADLAGLRAQGSFGQMDTALFKHDAPFSRRLASVQHKAPDWFERSHPTTAFRLPVRRTCSSGLSIVMV